MPIINCEQGNFYKLIEKKILQALLVIFEAITNAAQIWVNSILGGIKKFITGNTAYFIVLH